MNLGRFNSKILKEGRPLFGIVLRSSELSIAELVGLAGFDFAWIDMEHSMFSLKDVEALIVAFENRGCISLVRVPRNEADIIGKVLDMGANIVDVPHVETMEEAQRVVQSAKYFPLGRRGFASCTRSNKFGIEPLNEAIMREKNDENMVMVQLESRRALENMEDIAKVVGIDILFLGMGDLSQDLGVPGKWEDARLIDAIRKLGEVVRQTGKIGALAVSDLNKLNDCLDLGFKIVVCGMDTVLLKNSLKTLMDNIQARLKA